MKKLTKALIVFAVMLAPGFASGQIVEGILGILSVAPHVGTLANPDSVGAGRAVMALAATTKEDDFVNDTKMVAQDLGFQVAAIGTPQGKLSVLLVRQSTNIGNAILGKDWRIMVNLTLEPDNRNIEITAGLKGNDVKNSGTAQQAVDKIKDELAQKIPLAK